MGRKLLTNLVILVTFLLSLLVTDIDVLPADDPATWMAYALMVAVLGTLVIDVLWWMNIRRGVPLSTRAAIVESAAIGLAFGAAQVVFTSLLGLTPSRGAVLTVTSSVLGITVIGVGVILLIDSRRDEQERRVSLLEEGVALAEAREDVADIAGRMHDALAADINAALSPARIGIEERLAQQERRLSRDDWNAIAAQLRRTASETVRPLSRELWQQAAPDIPPLGFWGAVRNVIAHQPFQPLALVLVYLATSYAGTVTTLGWSRGLLSLALGVALIVGILGGANALMRRLPSHHAGIFITATLLLQLSGLLSFPVRGAWGDVPYTWAEFVLATVFGVILILLTSGFGSLRAHRDDVARTFQADIDNELVETIAASRQVAQLARESARVLHGTVQTRLIACAVSMERAAELDDIEAFQSALHEAQAILREPTRTEHDDAISLAVEVERKVALWSGLCSIDAEVEPEVGTLSGRGARDVGRVVEEGLSNAIRHGGAGHIDVRVSREGEAICVTVTDNGEGPTGGAPGLGSALLDSVCESWSLTASAPGSRLEARLPR